MTPRARKGWWLCAWSLTALSVLAGGDRLTRTGLRLTIEGEDGSLIGAWGHASLNASRTNALLAEGWHPLREEWVGYWRVPEPGFGRVVLKTDGRSSVALDGDEAAAAVERDVSPGVHRIRVTYRPGAEERREVFLKGVTSDERSFPVDRSDLFPDPPSGADQFVDWTARVAFLLAVLAWASLFALRLREGLPLANTLRRAPKVLLWGVVILAGSLRFEALVVRYAGAVAPDWADALAIRIGALRPGGFEHHPTARPYEGDPFSYLTTARAMTSFYEPSAREPLFPALTRLALYLSGDSDLGLNTLTALCSTLACLAIFALGRRLLSPRTGLLAAFLWAIDWEVVSLSVEGWRDGLFTLQVAACAAGLLGLYLQPSRRGAVLLGIGGGLTLLTRLSALTFLVPGLLLAVGLPGQAARRDRLRASAVGLGLMFLLAGPFMASCAIGFGDPFYPVNVHTGFYRARAGLERVPGSTALQFLSQWAPWDFLQTGFVGLTSYPFLNKWSGLSAMVPGLEVVSPWLALLGLPVVLWRPGGAMAVLLLLTSILPYAWTWRIPGGSEWRFTLPAYPFYLVFAALAMETAARGLMALKVRSRRGQVLRPVLRVAATAALVGCSLVWIDRWLGWSRVGEAVRNRREVLVGTGLHDRVFFGPGWRRIRGQTEEGPISMSGAEALLRLPVPAENGVRLVLRTGATAAPLSPVGVWVGDDRLTVLSGPREIGALDVVDVAPRPGGKGDLEVRLVKEPPSGRPEAPLTLLWIRVAPY